MIRAPRFGSKPVTPSDRLDEVVADDFRPDLRFYGLEGSASDEVSDEALQGVPPRLHPWRARENPEKNLNNFIDASKRMKNACNYIIGRK